MITFRLLMRGLELARPLGLPGELGARGGGPEPAEGEAGSSGLLASRMSLVSGGWWEYGGLHHLSSSPLYRTPVLYLCWI